MPISTHLVLKENMSAYFLSSSVNPMSYHSSVGSLQQDILFFYLKNILATNNTVVQKVFYLTREFCPAKPYSDPKVIAIKQRIFPIGPQKAIKRWKIMVCRLKNTLGDEC